MGHCIACLVVGTATWSAWGAYREGQALTARRTLLLLECRGVWLALLCSRGVVPFVQKDRSKSVSSACPLPLSRMFSGFRSLCDMEESTYVNAGYG